jgi:hypothetical protein
MYSSLHAEKSRLSSENARLRRGAEALRQSRRELELELRKKESELKQVRKELEQERQKNEELEKRIKEIERQKDKYRDMVFKSNRKKKEGTEIEGELELSEDSEDKVRTFQSQKRKRGGQEGHKGYGRSNPGKTDEEKRIYLEKCPVCESELKRSQTIKSHTVEDIPDLGKSLVKVVKYNTEEQWCPKCKKKVKGKPSGTIGRCRLGVNTLLYVLYHKYIGRETLEIIVSNLRSLYGLNVSRGALVGMMHRARKCMGGKYDELLKEIQNSSVKYADETSWRVEGINHWVWGFFTDHHAYYTIEESRGKGVPEKILKGSKPEDVLVRDDYAGYKKLPLQHQSCWAHLLRESRERAKRPEASSEIVQLHQRLKTMFSRLKKIVQQPFEPEKRKRAYKLFKVDIQHIVDTDYTNDDAREIHTRISNQKTNLITALLHENVPLTNNHSERNIRKFVVTRKISGGSRSNDGAKTHAVLMSVIQSAQLQNLSILPTLKGHLLNIPPPQNE